jgi:hypothetical protein
LTRNVPAVHTNSDTSELIDVAVADLAVIKNLASEPGVSLHCLASLAAEIESRLPAAIAAARSLGYSWSEIRAVSGISAERARRLVTIHAAHKELLAAELVVVPEAVVGQTPGHGKMPARPRPGAAVALSRDTAKLEDRGPSTLGRALTVWISAQL